MNLSLHRLLETGLAALLLTLSLPSLRGQEPVFNRAPLKENRYGELPLGAVRPEGWLLDQLERQRDGLTGHLDVLYEPIVGDNNAWLG